MGIPSQLPRRCNSILEGTVESNRIQIGGFLSMLLIQPHFFGRKIVTGNPVRDLYLMSEI